MCGSESIDSEGRMRDKLKKYISRKKTKNNRRGRGEEQGKE